MRHGLLSRIRPAFPGSFAVGATGAALLAAAALAGPTVNGDKDDLSIDRAIAALGDAPVAAVLGHLGEDARRFNAHVMTLSDPFFEGRVPGSRGNRLAADYVEHYFRQFGLVPAFAGTQTAADGAEILTSNESYRQPFSAGSDLSVTRQSVTVSESGQTLDLEPGTDFAVLGYSKTGSVSAPLAFVGYSIQDGPDGYSSYPEQTDLTGKIALLLRFEPIDDEGKSRWAGRAGGRWSPDAGLAPKFAAAVDRGAEAIILVCPPGADDPRVDRLESVRSTSPRFGGGQPVPVVQLSLEAADDLVRAGDPDGRSLQALRAVADESGGVIDLPGASVSIDVALERHDIMTDNVAAILPGRGGLADEYVIVGGHYDHLGMGYFGSVSGQTGVLHPGADDNASGTSGMLVVAEKLSKVYRDLPDGADARSVLFMAFSAEESGLVGSRYFTEHPSIDLSKASIMLKMDMIGRMRDNSMEVGGVGTAQGLDEWVRPFFEEAGIEVNETRSGVGPSDHASFYGKDIPVLFFFTGTHPDYHTPGDVGWKINNAGAARVIDMISNIALAAAERTEPLVFQEAGSRQRGPGRTSFKVRFGIRPGNYGQEGQGVLIDSVTEGGSAALAGLRDGDVLIRWNGKPVKDIMSWMPMLATHEPGDVVEVVVKRGDEQVTAKVTLQAPPTGG